jgi:hypothetical protein
MLRQAGEQHRLKVTVLPERHGNRFALSRSIDVRFPEMVNKVMGLITDPKQMATYSPEQIAEVVYDEAATDGRSSSAI